MDDDGSLSAATTAALEQMKREVFQGSRIAVIQRDLDNQVLYANPAALALFGLARQEDMRLDRLFIGAAAGVLDDQTRERRDRSMGAYRVNLRRQDDPDHELAVEVTGIPLLNEQGEAVGSLGLFRNLQDQVLSDRLRAMTLACAGTPDLLPQVAELLRPDLPFDLLMVSRVVADDSSWESEISFVHPPFRQDVPTAWFMLNEAQRAFMEASTGGRHDFEAVMSAPPWSEMADEPLCRQMLAMDLKSSMWRRIQRGAAGEGRPPEAIVTLLSRERDAYDAEDERLFRALPLDEAVLCGLDFEARRRDRCLIDMYRELNRCVDIRGACRCLSESLLEIFGWQSVALYRVDSGRDRIVQYSSSRRNTLGRIESVNDDGEGAGGGRELAIDDEGALGVVVRERRGVNLSSVPWAAQDHPAAGAAEATDATDAGAIRSELAVPIAFGDDDRARFIFHVTDPRRNAFSQAHEAQLTTIAADIAGAMQRISDLTLMTECVNNVSDPIIATDAKLRIRRVNPAAEALFGVGPRGLEGRNLLELFHHPLPLEALLAGTEAGDRIGELRVCRQALERPREGQGRPEPDQAGAAAAPGAPDAPGAPGALPADSGAAPSVFITRRDFPGKLGGHVFIARDLRPIRRSVQLEFLEETAYALAVETQAPLGMAMSCLEDHLEAAFRSDAAREQERGRELQAVLRQLGRVKHAFTRLAMYNREARVAASAACVIRLDAELDALLASLAASERRKVVFEKVATKVEIEADHTQLHIVVESLLSALLRAAPQTAMVRLTLVPDDDEVFLRLRGRLPPARRHGDRFGAPEAAQADLRLANPLLGKLMKNQGGALRTNALPDGDTEFVLNFPRRRAHG